MSITEQDSYRAALDSLHSTPKVQKLVIAFADDCLEAFTNGERIVPEYAASKFLFQKSDNLGRGDYYDVGNWRDQKSLLLRLSSSLQDILPHTTEVDTIIQRAVPHILETIASLIKNPKTYRGKSLVDVYRQELQEILGANDSSKLHLYSSSRADRKDRDNREGYLKVNGKKYTFVQNGKHIGDVYKALSIPVCVCETREQVTAFLQNMLAKYKQLYPHLREIQNWEKLKESDLFPLVQQWLSDNKIIYGGFWNGWYQSDTGSRPKPKGTHHCVDEKCCLLLPIMLRNSFISLESNKIKQKAALYVPTLPDASLVGYFPSIVLKKDSAVVGEGPLSMPDITGIV